MGSNSKGYNQKTIKDCYLLTKKVTVLFPDFREIHRSLLLVLVTTEIAVIVLPRIKWAQT